MQPAVSGVARVCSYDVAGMGESDKPPHDQSLDEIVDDLRALVKAAGEKPPYVLTGHSIADSIAADSPRDSPMRSRV